MAVDKFAQLYKQLNPAQREAVDTIEGPVMVVAGPGTGKTQVLTLRIANILRQTDTPPDGILALTFTNSGVHSMRERLVELVGSAGYRVVINTFHGFCNEIIQRFPAEFPRIIGSRNASLAEQIKILEEIINRAGSKKLKKLKPYGAPFYYLSAILSAIDKLKKDNLQTAPEPELNLIYRGYERALRKRRLYDFADMVMEVIAVLKKRKTFLRQLQEEYLYLLADEHQDANQSQNQLLALLADYHAHPNLFLVGDEKQAIFQFQGASLENFNYFKKLYPAAKLITLTHNYRSTQNILDAAHSLIDSGLTAAAGKLLAATPAPKTQKIKAIACAGPSAEEQFVAREIRQKIKAGTAPDEIAVIYRDNADAAPLALALEKLGVPIVIQSQINLLSDLTVRKVILILETVHHFGDEGYLPKLLHLDFLNLEPLAIYRVKTYRDLPKNISKMLADWRRLSQNENLLTLFSVVLEESGLLAHLLKIAEGEEKLAKLQSFFEELKELAANHPDYRLADFIEHLETLRRHSLGFPQTVPSAKSGARLLTAHKSKGLEFDEVYIVRATDGHFGNRRKQTSLIASEEDEGGERRLFYVALTRARKQVTITYAKHARNGRPQLPSQFVEEIDKRLVEFLEPKNLKTGATENLRPKPAIKSSLSEKAYLNKIFLERGLSVTNINNYLSCPLKYFYQNLLRLPQAQEKYLLYGTAIHQTLREFFDQYRAGRKMSEQKLLARFQDYLRQQPLAPHDFKSAREKGGEALAGYLKFHQTWPNRIINEFSLRGVLLDGKLKLNGKIDKLEISENGEVRVVDYKTGKPKTRNHILGLTKSAGSGDYFRQLAFYKLLLEQSDAKKYRVTSGLVDFVEPDEKGRYRQEEFALADQDAAGLRALAQETAQKILNLDFFTAGCGEPDCEWCELYELTR